MSQEAVTRALAAYDPARLTLCSIGSHSALEVAYGARAQALHNLVVTAKGREQTGTVPREEGDEEVAHVSGEPLTRLVDR